MAITSPSLSRASLACSSLTASMTLRASRPSANSNEASRAATLAGNAGNQFRRRAAGRQVNRLAADSGCRTRRADIFDYHTHRSSLRDQPAVDEPEADVGQSLGFRAAVFTCSTVTFPDLAESSAARSSIRGFLHRAR